MAVTVLRRVVLLVERDRVRSVTVSACRGLSAGWAAAYAGIVSAPPIAIVDGATRGRHRANRACTHDKNMTRQLLIDPRWRHMSRGNAKNTWSEKTPG
jgi:hypothetical protein